MNLWNWPIGYCCGGFFSASVANRGCKRIYFGMWWQQSVWTCACVTVVKTSCLKVPICLSLGRVIDSFTPLQKRSPFKEQKWESQCPCHLRYGVSLTAYYPMWRPFIAGFSVILFLIGHYDILLSRAFDVRKVLWASSRLKGHFFSYYHCSCLANRR